MSNDDDKWVPRLLFLVAVALFIACAYLEVDSKIQRSQLRDLQRRVGHLEQQRVRFCVDCPNWK